MSSPDITRANESEHPVDSRRSRLGDVQGLRAIAVLLVVVYHAGLPVPGGFVGVDVFFVISGFVITALLVRELRSHGRIRFARFYTRRVRRLLPALTVLLLATGLGSMLLQSPIGAQQDTALAGIGSSAWLANGALYFITGDYFDNAADTIPLLHMWSLAVEEQFYLVFPALLLGGFVVARRLGRSGLRGATVAMCIAFALSFAVSLWLSGGHSLPGVAKPETAAFYLAPTRAWEFGAGALVAIWAARSPRLGRTPTLAAAALGTLLLAAAAAFIHSTTPFPGFAALLPVAGTALLIVAGRGESNPVSTVLNSSALQRIGDLSYSWYLWHWPFIVFAALLLPERPWVKVVAAAVSLGAAHLSYVFVEEPIRHRESTSGWATLRVVAAGVIAPLLVFTALYAGASRSWGNEEVAAMAAQVRPKPMGYAQGCHVTTPISRRDLTACTWNRDATGTPVYLLGDSNAVQYSDGLIAAGRATGHPVTIATMGGCPMVDLTLVQQGVVQTACRDYVTDAQRWLEEAPKGIVVMSAASHAIDQETTELRQAAPPTTSVSVADKAQAWESGLASALRGVAAAGQHPIVVRTIPHFGTGDGPYWTPSDCLLPRMWAEPGRCGEQESLAEATRLQSLSLRAEEAALNLTQTQSVDLRQRLCPNAICATDVDNRWVYRDGLHISTTTSRELTPVLAGALTAARD